MTSQPESLEAQSDARRNRLAGWAAGIAGIALISAAIGLWARHGAAVFFEMVSAGIAYCF